MDDGFVSIFKTSDPGVLPLATMALDAEGVEYVVRSGGTGQQPEWNIVVFQDVATKARDLVVDLETVPGAPPSLTPIPIPDSLEAAAITLEDAANGIAIGAITESQLQELTARLEEESPQQYFVNAPTIDMLKTAGADERLVAMLENAVGSSDGLHIHWRV